MAACSREQVRHVGPTVRLGGGETWTVIFDELSTQVVGFDASTYTYTGMMSLLRGGGGGACHGHHHETCKGHVWKLHRVKIKSGRFVIRFA